MPRGKYECPTCGSPCIKEGGCYKHNEESKAKHKISMKKYRSTETFKEKRRVKHQDVIPKKKKEENDSSSESESETEVFDNNEKLKKQLDEIEVDVQKLKSEGYIKDDLDDVELESASNSESKSSLESESDD